jgi:hypothetical protein
MGEKTFTDAEITAACGLHVDNLRKLITWGAVRPVQSGGGRGRVRLWTLKQAMRIAVTAQFVEANFSLQMAHTLSYCLPFDDILQFFDPDFLKDIDLEDPKEAHTKKMLSPEEEKYWPSLDHIGSDFFIVDGQAVYGDLLADSGILFGIIDYRENKYFPIWTISSPLWGAISESLGKPPELGWRNIDRKSLLVDDVFLFSDDYEIKKELTKEKQGKFDCQVNYVREMKFKTLTYINFAAGLSMTFRRLLGLPVNYHPTEVPDDITDDEPNTTSEP